MTNQYKGYLIDLDGTMYLGEEKIPEAGPFVDHLREANKPFLFVTNNSTNHPQEVVKKLERLGVQAKQEEVFTSSIATTNYLKSLEGNSIYVIGEEGLVDSLLDAGFTIDDKNPDHVVVGLDRQVDYHQFETATLAIRSGATFIATNPDTNLPTEKGMVPGSGALVALLEAATRVKATVVGKPNSIIMEEAVALLGLPKNEILMVGDNYETDILAGIDNNIPSLLVLTGFTKAEDLKDVDKQPTHMVNKLSDWSV